MGNAAFAVSFIFLYITTGQSVSSKLVVNFLCNVQKVKEYQGFWILIGVLPWQINSTLIIFLYLHLSLVFLPKRLIFQGFPTFEFSFLFKVSSQIFSYFLMFFPAILVNPLVKQAPLPTGFFNYSLSDILLPLHHQNSHGCKCSRLPSYFYECQFLNTAYTILP